MLEPLSRSEIAAMLRPILVRCDAAGRVFVVKMASAEVPDQSTISPELRAEMLEAFWKEMARKI